VLRWAIEEGYSFESQRFGKRAQLVRERGKGQEQGTKKGNEEEGGKMFALKGGDQ